MLGNIDAWITREPEMSKADAAEVWAVIEHDGRDADDRSKVWKLVNVELDDMGTQCMGCDDLLAGKQAYIDGENTGTAREIVCPACVKVLPPPDEGYRD